MNLEAKEESKIDESDGQDDQAEKDALKKRRKSQIVQFKKLLIHY